jgi:hypothetical protein
MSSSSPHLRSRVSWFRMWWTCIMDEERLKPSSPRRISKTTLIAGVPTPSAERRLWQVACQWVWNIRLALGFALQGEELREMEWSPASERPPRICSSEQPPETYGPWQLARDSGRGQIPASAFTLHDEVSLRCPTGAPLWLSEMRQENAFTEAGLHMWLS